MKLKKNDIVEIIEKDASRNLTYEVGTKWIVKEDDSDLSCIEVYDKRQRDGVGLLYRENVKQVNLPKQNYNFKVGQIYKVIVQRGSSPFSYDKFYAVNPERDFRGNYILSDDGIKYYADDFGNRDFNTSNTYLELINDSKEPTIELQFLINYLEEEGLSTRETIAFLKGYLKGERFKND